MIPTMLLLVWPSVGGRGSPSVAHQGCRRVWKHARHRVGLLPAGDSNPTRSVHRAAQCGVMAAPFTVRSAVMVVYELFMTLARPKGELTRMPFGRHDRGTETRM